MTDCHGPARRDPPTHLGLFISRAPQIGLSLTSPRRPGPPASPGTGHCGSRRTRAAWPPSRTRWEHGMGPGSRRLAIPNGAHRHQTNRPELPLRPPGLPELWLTLSSCPARGLERNSAPRISSRIHGFRTKAPPPAIPVNTAGPAGTDLRFPRAPRPRLPAEEEARVAGRVLRPWPRPRACARGAPLASSDV